VKKPWVSTFVPLLPVGETVRACASSSENEIFYGSEVFPSRIRNDRRSGFSETVLGFWIRVHDGSVLFILSVVCVSKLVVSQAPRI
jgi:hypothetical protein